MDIKEIVPYYYSKNPFLKWIFTRRLEIAINLAKPKLESGENIRVVDLGFGQGLLFEFLEKYPSNVEIFGVDIEESAEKIKERFTRTHIQIADLRKTGYTDEFFDVVFCLDTLEHFKSLREPIEEIKRILKPNGMLIISIPTETFIYKMARFLVTGTTSMETAPCSPHYHMAKDIEKFLAENGFLEVKNIHLPPLPFLSLFHIISLKKK